MMDWSPRCYIPSFFEIGPLVPEKTILKSFTIYEHGGHLGHVTWTIYINFCYPFPMRLHMKFGFDWLSGFRGEDDDNHDGRRSMCVL